MSAMTSHANQEKEKEKIPLLLEKEVKKKKIHQ
jgi:hypothetical protein